MTDPYQRQRPSMDLRKMNDPRPGQVVQCKVCHKMVPAEDAWVDLRGHAGDIYHEKCIPKQAPEPKMYLTASEARKGKKTYKVPHDWDAYFDVADVNEEGRTGNVSGRVPLVVTAKSRIEAFDRVRDEEVKYNRSHNKTMAVGRGVANTPRLSR